MASNIGGELVALAFSQPVIAGLIAYTVIENTRFKHEKTQVKVFYIGLSAFTGMLVGSFAANAFYEPY